MVRRGAALHPHVEGCGEQAGMPACLPMLERRGTLGCTDEMMPEWVHTGKVRLLHQ